MPGGCARGEGKGGMGDPTIEIRGDIWISF
jgi:hypothetical protein